MKDSEGTLAFLLRFNLELAAKESAGKGGLSCGRVSAMLSDMKVTKTVTVRELKRGTPEEALGPGEALRVKKPSGKGFLLLRETETPDLAALHKEIMRDILLSGPSQKTDLAAWHQEDEE